MRKVVRPAPAVVVVGFLLAGQVGATAGAIGGAAVRGALAVVTVVLFVLVVLCHHVEVGPTVRAVSWTATVEVARDEVEAVRRGGSGRSASLVGEDWYVAVPFLVGPRRVARALDVPLLTPDGDEVDRRAEVRAMLWVLGGVVLTFALALALAATA